MSIGENIKKYRESFPMSLEAMAAQLGLPVDQYRAIELGQRTLSFVEIQKISQVLKVSVDSLFAEKAEKADAEETEEEGSVLMPMDELKNLLGMMRDK